MRCGPQIILGCLLSLSGGENRGGEKGEGRGERRILGCLLSLSGGGNRGERREEKGEGREGFPVGNYEVWPSDHFGLFAKFKWGGE